MNTDDHGCTRSPAPPPKKNAGGSGARCFSVVIGVHLWFLFLAAPAIAVDPCPAPRDCAAVTVRAPANPVPIGATTVVRLALAQGAADLQPGGLDELAALTVSLSIPGLELADCSAPGADGLNPSFALLSTVAGPYRAIVQNLVCASRPSCLCPDDGQSRDEHVNLLLIGTPSGGNVPPLPNGDLLGISVRVLPGASSTVPLHVYSALDDPDGPPRPARAAWLSVADRNAVDRTLDADSDSLNVRINDAELQVGESTPATATATATATEPPTTATASTTPVRTATATATATGLPVCTGDCDRNRVVSVNELIAGVSIALGSLPLSSCPVFDCTGGGQVEVACLVAAVNNALDGCPAR